MLETRNLNPHDEGKQQESNYASYLTASADELSGAPKILCEIIEKTPPDEVESALSATGFLPTSEIVQEVLKLSYGFPMAAVKFFRWSGLVHNHTERSWNLMVDLLGRNKLFEEMWDAIRSMRQEGRLSITAFVSAFGSYCVAGRFSEAIMTFEVMESCWKDNRIGNISLMSTATSAPDKEERQEGRIFPWCKWDTAKEITCAKVLSTLSHHARILIPSK